MKNYFVFGLVDLFQSINQHIHTIVTIKKIEIIYNKPKKRVDSQERQKNNQTNNDRISQTLYNIKKKKYQ